MKKCQFHVVPFIYIFEKFAIKNDSENIKETFLRVNILSQFFLQNKN